MADFDPVAEGATQASQIFDPAKEGATLIQPQNISASSPVSPANQNQQKFNYYMGTGRTPIDTLRDVAAGAIGTMGKGGQLIASGLTGGYAPTVDWNQITNAIASPNQSAWGAMARGLGSVAPLAPIAGPSVVGNAIAAGTAGAINADPNQTNLGGYLPHGRLGSFIENAALTGGLGMGINKLIPPSSGAVNANFSPQFSMPSSASEFTNAPYTQPSYVQGINFKGAPTQEAPSTQSEFTNIPYSQPAFLNKPSTPLTSDEVAKDLHSTFVGDQTPDASLKKLASEVNGKYDQYHDYLGNKYNILFNKNNENAFDKKMNPIQIKDTPLSNANYGSQLHELDFPTQTENTNQYNYQFHDFKFPTDNLQDLHDTLVENPTVWNAHKMQSELGSEIGSMQRQNSKGNLDDSGRNLLSTYGNMRRILKNNIYDTLENAQKGLGDEYNGITSDWQKYVIPFHSDTDLKDIATGKVKNPSNNQVVSIFRNPEENINTVSSLLSADAKNRIVSAGMGKNKFQSTPRDMISGHNAIYSKGLNSYLDPYYEDQFSNLRSLKNNEDIQKNNDKANQSLSEQLRSAHESTIKQSMNQSNNSMAALRRAQQESGNVLDQYAAENARKNKLLSDQMQSAYENAGRQSAEQSKNSYQNYMNAQREAEKYLTQNKSALEPPLKNYFLRNALLSTGSLGFGALLENVLANPNSLLGAYIGNELAKSMHKKVKSLKQ